MFNFGKLPRRAPAGGGTPAAIFARQMRLSETAGPEAPRRTPRALAASSRASNQPGSLSRGAAALLPCRSAAGVGSKGDAPFGLSWGGGLNSRRRDLGGGGSIPQAASLVSCRREATGQAGAAGLLFCPAGDGVASGKGPPRLERNGVSPSSWEAAALKQPRHAGPASPAKAIFGGTLRPRPRNIGPGLARAAGAQTQAPLSWKRDPRDGAPPGSRTACKRRLGGRGAPEPRCSRLCAPSRRDWLATLVGRSAKLWRAHGAAGCPVTNLFLIVLF